MQGIILAAGRGSRLGKITKGQPKLTLNINGMRIFEWQMKVIADKVDELIVMLEYGVEDSSIEEVREEFRPTRYDTHISFGI